MKIRGAERSDRESAAAPTSSRSNATSGAAVGGQAVSGGNPYGTSGSTSGLAPVVDGRNANYLLGPDKGTTSKREACPGWMQTSGLDYCIRPQDQLRPADVRR